MGKGVCAVCGEGETVKAHLFPRALMLDMRGDAKALRAGSRHRDGYLESQNGRWDDRFLCAAHEKMLGPADDYAVRLARKIADIQPPPWGPKSVQVDNPRPDLLTRFAYASVWRHVMAPTNAKLKLDLGPYEMRLRAALFDGGALDLQVLASVSGAATANGLTSYALEPHRQKIAEFNTWHFVIGRLDINLKTDARPFPKDWSELTADRDPLTLVVSDVFDLATIPVLRPITDRIRASGRRGARP